jgi:hypothetical protein
VLLPAPAGRCDGRLLMFVLFELLMKLLLLLIVMLLFEPHLQP